MSNRRREERVPRLFDVRLRLATLNGWVDLGDRIRACSVRDFSMHGLRLSVNLPLPVGSRLEVSVVEPGGATLQVEGEIRWLSSGGLPHDHRIGVDLAVSPGESLAAWESFVAKLAASQPQGAAAPWGAGRGRALDGDGDARD